MKKTNATNPKYRAGTPWQLMYLNKTTTNVCTVWMGWMSKHGLAQGNCKNPRHRVLHNLIDYFSRTLPSHNKDDSQTNWAFQTRGTEGGLHMLNQGSYWAISIRRLQQNASDGCLMSKKERKANTIDNAKQNLGFLCLHVNVSPLIVFQRWVFSDLKCCLHVDKRPQPINTHTLTKIPIYTWSYV